MFEIVTKDNKVYQLNQTDPQAIKRLASALELIPVTLSNGKIEYFSKNSVARIQSKPVRDDSKKGLPDGQHNDRRADLNSESIARFKKMRNKAGL